MRKTWFISGLRRQFIINNLNKIGIIMFCNTVWNGLHILPDGYIRLCSIGANSKLELDHQRCRDSDGKVMNILTHSINDIMNSDKHREVRLLNMKDPSAWSPHCDCCEKREIAVNFVANHKNKSRRIFLMDVKVSHQGAELINKAAPDGSINWMPTSLDIRFGNLCNQKCIMCSPSYSNLWYDEWFEFNNTNSFGHGDKVFAIQNKETGKWKSPPELQWYNDPRWWPQFEKMMPHLQHIYITGGEPMVTPAHDVMLDKLIASGHAKHIWLEYDTNGSVVNDKIVNRWQHFKKVDLRLSMDATGQQYEIIRFPGKWDKFKENVLKLKAYEQMLKGVLHIQSLTSCFQMTTAYTTIASEEWCKSVSVPFHLRFLEGPRFHSIESLPISARRDLIEYFKQYESTSEKAPMLIRHLEAHITDPGQPEELLKFVKFMNYLDSTRGTNWKDTFPKTRDMVLKAIGVITRD